jgi:uncharacterized HAD superfamily protein
MSRLTIGIDIDGTVYPWTRAANEAVMGRFPETEDPGEHQAWDYLKSVLGSDERWRWLWSPEAAERVFGRLDLIFEHAADTINALAKEHDVHFVTHRNPEKTGVATAMWIREHFSGYKGIHVLDNSVRKCDVLNWDVFVDDKVETIHEFCVETMVSPLLMPTRPWNDHYKSDFVSRFTDWREVPEILQEAC